MKKIIIGIAIFLSLISFFKEDIKAGIENTSNISVLNTEIFLQELK